MPDAKRTSLSKDIRNRKDILKYGLRLPYNKQDIENNCSPMIIFYVDQAYLTNLKKQILNKKEDSSLDI